MPASPNSVSSFTPQYAGSYQVVDVSLTPAQVAATTTAVQTFTVNGVKAAQAASGSMPAIPADFLVGINPPSHVANVSAVTGWVSADNTVSVIFVNANAAASTPPSGVWRFCLMSQDNAKYSFDG